ncbi:hypothetical protein F0562_028430 [Nyssa sinensis]|uniref:Protein kinase domain-containing protein n=1 Tax=Nyssa sinensis TaxID=561372 RepID=A0A5J5B255_9ASTE|nr:hypothetical protein F0562_028430 [Nyssa sinensis]
MGAKPRARSHAKLRNTRRSPRSEPRTPPAKPRRDGSPSKKRRSSRKLPRSPTRRLTASRSRSPRSPRRSSGGGPRRSMRRFLREPMRQRSWQSRTVADEEHLERRLKASFKALEEAELPRLKGRETRSYSYSIQGHDLEAVEKISGQSSNQERVGLVRLTAMKVLKEHTSSVEVKSCMLSLQSTYKLKQLKWSVRMTIAIGVAKALVYLLSCSPPIIHRDVV